MSLFVSKSLHTTSKKWQSKLVNEVKLAERFYELWDDNHANYDVFK